jgi:class 3 adenylate cyclase
MRDYLDEAMKHIGAAEKAKAGDDGTFEDPLFQAQAAIACALIDQAESLRELRQIMRSQEEAGIGR